MPCVIRVSPAAEPASEYLTSSQPLYHETFLPYEDVKKEQQDESTLIASRIAVVNEDPEECVSFQREVPYYCDEEEAFPNVSEYEEQSVLEVPSTEEVEEEAVIEKTQEEKEDVLVKPASVQVPDMLWEVSHYFPSRASSHWMPPQPPVHCKPANYSPMHLWFSRLQAHPLYSSCYYVVGRYCPAPSEAVAEQEWVAACSAWWTELTQTMQARGLTTLSSTYSWNPYSLECAVRFHTTAAQPNEVANVPVAPRGTSASEEAASFAVPPPPEYEAFVEVYGATKILCEHLYLSAMARWWRSASRWAAATAALRTWVCPPPTTGSSAEAWGSSAHHWWLLTLAEMRIEDEKNAQRAERKAAALAKVLAKVSAPVRCVAETSSKEFLVKEAATLW